MKLNSFETALVGAFLAVINYLLLELGSLSKSLHVALTSLVVLLAALLVNPPKKAEP